MTKGSCPYIITDCFIGVVVSFCAIGFFVMILSASSKTKEEKYDAEIRIAAVQQYQNEKTEAANKRILEIEKELRREKPLDSHDQSRDNFRDFVI